jgi:Flp pilus assembly protein TadG
MYSHNPPVIARLRHQRGSVLVLVAAAMFPIIGMLTFAIDVSHWFDYSRNLQNRADAAALAGSQMLGACIGTTGTAGNTTNGLQSAAGKWAQLYTGASVGENAANVPYTDAQVAASTTAAAGSGNGPGTGWDVTHNGYINNTLPVSPVTSPLTLVAGLANINNFWVALNGDNYADSTSGNTSFTMNLAASGATFCDSDPTFDATDTECFHQPKPLPPNTRLAADCASGAMVDVKLTQQRVPLFVPLFSGLNPTIHAHARVTLKGEASPADVRAIAVSDPGSFACVTVKYFTDDGTNTLLGTAVLTETDPANFVFSNPVAVSGVPNSGPTSITIPAGANVYVQPFLSDCSGNGETFDDSTHSGVELINSFGTTAPTAGQGPKITDGGVTLAIQGGGTCPASTDQYFSSGGCNVTPTAHVTFAPNVNGSVTAVDTSTGASLDLNPDNTGKVWTPNGQKHFTIGDQTGQHPIRIDWTQTSGSVNNGTLQCGNNTGNPKIPPCTGTFGIQQQAFGACNGCDQPDDSGPIVLSQIRLSTDAAGVTGENAFQQGTTKQLVITLQLAGIRAETNSGAKPVIIRFSGSNNHQTGLVDCGQGNGGSNDAYVIYGGCGPNNPFEPPGCTGTGLSCKLPALNPLYVYGRGNPTDCSPAQDQNYTGWPGGNHQDCVQTTPGTRRTDIVCGLLQWITGVTPQSFSASSSACQGNTGGSCTPNNWPDYNKDPNDPRKITFILTSPIDLTPLGTGTSPQLWIPIRRFATFYVTGWDTSLDPKCGNNGNPNNDSFPGANGGKASQNGAIWGHWIFDVDTGGVPANGGCDLSSIEPINCVPTLTR